MRRTRRRLVSAGIAVLLGVVTAAQATAAEEPTQGADVVDALDRAAHPLRNTAPGDSVDDLRPLGAAVGDASVLSVGEATHSSGEFVTEQHRIMRYLAEHKGFRTFAREMSWHTGVRLNQYVLRGVGDPGQIMSDELDTYYQVFDNEELLDLIRWMRWYNTRHEDKLQIMGDDPTFPGPVLFDKVNGYVDQHHPELSGAFARLYAGMAPKRGTTLQEYMGASMKKSLSRRKAEASRAWAAYELLRAQGADGDQRSSEWAVQHARVLAQSFTEYSFDTSKAEGRADAGRYRDKAMAANTVWWQQHQQDKVMVSNMTAHASYQPIDRELAPDPAGRHLRERLGDRFVNVGLSFHHGSFNAGDPKDNYRKFTVGEPTSEQNEHTLGQVRYDDYLVDLRDVPEPADRWLQQKRPTRNIGGSFDPSKQDAGQFDVALGNSYDILVHLDEVHETNLRFN